MVRHGGFHLSLCIDLSHILHLIYCRCFLIDSCAQIFFFCHTVKRSPWCISEISPLTVSHPLYLLLSLLAHLLLHPYTSALGPLHQLLFAIPLGLCVIFLPAPINITGRLLYLKPVMIMVRGMALIWGCMLDRWPFLPAGLIAHWAYLNTGCLPPTRCIAHTCAHSHKTE